MSITIILVQFDKFHFSSGFISFKDEQKQNINEKLEQFNTFQFSNGLIKI